MNVDAWRKVCCAVWPSSFLQLYQPVKVGEFFWLSVRVTSVNYSSMRLAIQVEMVFRGWSASRSFVDRDVYQTTELSPFST